MVALQAIPAPIWSKNGIQNNMRISTYKANVMHSFDGKFGIRIAFWSSNWLFCNIFPDGTPCWILGQNHFHSNFKVYTDDMCTFHNQISDLRFSVNTAGLILLFYMLVILGIMFREFKFRNIMSWLRDNHNLYFKYVWEMWNTSVK